MTDQNPMSLPLAPLHVQAVAWTHFEPPRHTPWTTDAEGGEALAEYAGRACYQSWTKPNPATATNAGYLRHIMEVGHYSVLEHGVVTMDLRGISRSLTHELVRHRHFSFSQLSQRYVDSGNAGLVMPPEVAGDPVAETFVGVAWGNALSAYDALVQHLDEKLSLSEELSKTERRKRARQAARAVMPNMTETQIVVTGNYRAWRHFVDMRAAAPADVEIRRLAVAVLRELQRIAPNVFGDYEIITLPDGTEAASSPYREQS